MDFGQDSGLTSKLTDQQMGQRRVCEWLVSKKIMWTRRTKNINMLKDNLKLRTVWKVDFGQESGLTYH